VEDIVDETRGVFNMGKVGRFWVGFEDCVWYNTCPDFAVFEWRRRVVFAVDEKRLVRNSPDEGPQVAVNDVFERFAAM